MLVERGLSTLLRHGAGRAAGLTVLCHAVPDPAFVRAQLIPDSSERNDDKLYFFFREKSADAPLSPGVYSRIGRICLVGGAAGRQGAGSGAGTAERGGPSVAERRRGPLLPREQVEHLPESPACLLGAGTRWDRNSLR